MKKLKSNWDKIALAAIIICAGVLSVWGIWKEGYGNEFYAACVKSMLTSWKNFFFVSLDSSGFVTVDKPPVSLWIQAAFAKVLGFSGWSVILPQGLAAAASVYLIYITVKRHFGKVAGLVSALALALSPIFIVISRTNNTDTILILFMVLSVWAMMKAADKADFKWLALSAVFLGIAYNTKTLQAFLILPALFAGYFFTANTTWKKRFLHMVGAVLILAVVSLSWSIIVDLTPASQRPYVDNSTNNSELELAVNYNGLQRLTGMNNGFGTKSTGASGDGLISDDKSDTDKNSTADQGGKVPTNSDSTAASENKRIDGMPGSGSFDGFEGFGGAAPDGGVRTGGGGGMFNHGAQSLLRMFNSDLGGQDSWLLIFGLFAALALLLRMRKKYEPEKEARMMLLRNAIIWGGSVITMVFWFSVAQFYHEYYIATMAPFLAALVGIGAVLLWKMFKEDGLMGYLMPLSFAVSVAIQALMLAYWPSYARILIPALLILSGIPIIVLTVSKILKRKLAEKLAATIISIAVAGLLITPAVWTGYSVINYRSNYVTPTAGPSTTGFGSFSRMGTQAGTDRIRPEDGKNAFPGNDNNRAYFPANGYFSPGNRNGGEVPDGSGSTAGGAPADGPGNGGGENVNSNLISYLLKNYNGEKWLVAVPNSNSAASIILKTDKAVMSVGGFSGRDNILTVSSLQEMVKNHELRYYLVTGNGGTSSAAITAWVREHGKAISSSQYGGSSGGNFGGTLYDLYS